MKKDSARNLILLMLWLTLMIWLVARTPPRTETEGRLKTMVADLDFMFRNGSVLSKHENAKTGAALALYNLDALTWGGQKAVMLKGSLATKGWTAVDENSHIFVMCKNGMKASISRDADKISVNGLEKAAYSVSMEFNAGTKDFCG
ncbi:MULTISPECIES: hypothetical protein [Burkholderiaceae]|uniref:hypothetical protein n=1 Tax=Burkholderiaceae TaxID=119060 RepID=UPI00076B8E81|nr:MULTISPECIES: hypothetical protein [Burkholderiaceae]AME26516.1 hypothetical protein AXG89_21920 [Burkholderia sp. PAMC 26561]